jgi:Cu(I)/Ag(I) efflux system membrane fusion protein
MKMMKTILFAAAVGLLAGVGVRASDNPALTAPVKSVYGHYLKIQADLANDSLTGVAENANAITKAVQGDAKILPVEVGTKAEALAKAKDLSAARDAFKPLSDALIKYLADNKAKGAYVEVYCPMARASWLQADKNVNNPYFGTAMSGCGVIKE